MNYLDNVQLKRQELADQKADKNEKVTQIVHEKQLNEAVTKAIHESHEDNKKHRESTTLKVKIENPEVGVSNLPDLALREDINKLVNAIQSMDVKPEAVEFDPVVSALNELGSKLDTLPRQFPEIEKVEEVSVNNLSELKDFIKPVADAISKLDLKPVVNIEKEEQKEIDLSPLLTAIENLGSKLNTLEVPELDIEPLITSTNKVTSAINSLSFPVPNYVLPFKDVEGRAVQVQLDASGNLPVTSSGTSSGGKATDAYGIQAISDDGTYKYFFFEDASANYYVMRKNLSTSVFTYTKGTGGYSSVYQSSILGPSGSPTFADYGTTF